MGEISIHLDMPFGSYVIDYKYIKCGSASPKSDATGFSGDAIHAIQDAAEISQDYNLLTKRARPIDR